jgi:hypothetical protein
MGSHEYKIVMDSGTFRAASGHDLRPPEPDFKPLQYIQ